MEATQVRGCRVTLEDMSREEAVPTTEEDILEDSFPLLASRTFHRTILAKAQEECIPTTLALLT
jgi:hypothetical protein